MGNASMTIIDDGLSGQSPLRTMALPFTVADLRMAFREVGAVSEIT